MTATLLAELVATSARVAGTRARLAKQTALAEFLAGLPDAELRLAVCYLSGVLPQGRVGLGYATVARALPASAAPHASLRLIDVDAFLDRFAAIAGAGAVARRRDLLRALLAAASAPEAEFLLRLFGGELRQGALQGVLVEAVAQATAVRAEVLRRALMLSGDLAEVTLLARRAGEAGLEAVAPAPFRPLQPMLAEPAADAGEAVERLGEAVFEYKLDGARVQAHKRGREVRVYSRRLNDVTAAVPEIVEVVGASSAESLILDGETLALRPGGKPHPFQSTMRRFGRRLDVERLRAELPLSVFFFDCLSCDGEDLTRAPTLERLRRLDAVLPPEHRMPRCVTGEAPRAEQFLAASLQAGHEGVMAKSTRAPYAAGSRGSDWLKIKPVHTLDLVVLAAEWGHGRRRGWLSNLHLGARDTAAGGFVMLGKTFKGLTDELLRWQTGALQKIAVREEDGTVFVEPQLVVEIACNDIQASPRYPAGLALRFARVRRYRPDKRPADADTVDTVRALHQRSGG